MSELRYRPSDHLLFYRDSNGFTEQSDLGELILTITPEQKWPREPVFVKTEYNQLRIELLRGNINSKLVWVGKFQVPGRNSLSSFDESWFRRLETSFSMSR